MKIKLIAISFVFLYATNCIAAFSSVENNQLSEMNEKSKTQLSSDIETLNKSINAQIMNSPENKKLLIDLRKSWDDTIDKKCQLETIDSKGTDAEIAEMNTCLSKGYQQEIKYFDGLLP